MNLRRALLFGKVMNMDEEKVANFINSQKSNFDEFILCFCIDQKDAEYVERNIVTKGWAGEKVGAELSSLILRKMRQKAYKMGEEIKKKVGDVRLRLITEIDYEENLLRRIIERENPEKIVWFRGRVSFWKRIFRKKPVLLDAGDVEIIEE